MDESNIGRKEEGNKKDPKWLSVVKDRYKDCFETILQGKRNLGFVDQNTNGTIETEYDIRMRDDVFEFIDKIRNKLPEYILLAATQNNLGAGLGAYRTASYFVTATHETYNFSTVGNETIEQKFHPHSSEFLGIDQIRHMPSRPRNITISSPQTENLKRGQVREDVEILLLRVRGYLSDSEKEEYLYPLEQRIAVLEVEKLLKIVQGLQEYGRLSKEKVLAFFDAFPELYKRQLPNSMDLGEKEPGSLEGIKTDPEDHSRVRRLFFLPLSKELVIAPGVIVESSGNGHNYQPDFNRIEAASDPDWFHCATSVVFAVWDFLPKRYAKDKYNY